MTGPLYMRALVLDVEALPELASLFEEHLETYGFTAPDGGWKREYFTRQLIGGMLRTVPEDELADQSASVKSELSLFIRVDGGGGVSASFDSSARPSISVSLPRPNMTDAIIKIQEAAAEHLYASGTPRVQWSRLASWLPMVPWAALAASAVWLQASAPPTVAGSLFVWLTTAFAFGGAVALSLHLKRVRRDRWAGHRIRLESRKETYARRADTHKNIKVALITAPITLVGGILLAAALGFLRLKS
ncbi:hypothetical protein DOE76_12600 [Leifsonia sp. ku-ls]|nr:hypothetical protein DOE76_12600 [Leifsonia sp. ku-ls]